MKVDHVPNVVAAQAGAHKPQPAQDAAAPASSDTGADFPAGIAAGGPSGPVKSALSPAHRAAEYLSGAAGFGADGSNYKNFGQVVSEFVRGILNMSSEPDVPATDAVADPITDPVTDPVADPITDPVTDGESAGIIAPGDGETAPTETAATSGASTEGATGGGDGGIIVPPVDDGSAAEADLLDALLDGGEGEDEASA